MISSATLATLFGYSFELTMRQTEAVSHEQSLLTPLDGGNSVNWLVGHLVSSRTRALVLVREQAVWDETQRRPYRSGASPLSPSDPGCRSIAELRAAFAESQQRLLRGLAATTPEQLLQPSEYQQLTAGDSLAYLQFHEAHHVGQILLLAPLLGVSAVWLQD